MFHTSRSIGLFTKEKFLTTCGDFKAYTEWEYYGRPGLFTEAGTPPVCDYNDGSPGAAIRMNPSDNEYSQKVYKETKEPERGSVLPVLLQSMPVHRHLFYRGFQR